MGRHRRGIRYPHSCEDSMKINARAFWDFLIEKKHVEKERGRWKIKSLSRFTPISDHTSSRLGYRLFRDALKRVRDASYCPTDKQITEIIRYVPDRGYLNIYLDSLLDPLQKPKHLYNSYTC